MDGTCTKNHSECGSCKNHVCVNGLKGNAIGLRIAQLLIMQCMEVNLDNPTILQGLELALRTITKELTEEARKIGNTNTK